MTSVKKTAGRALVLLVFAACAERPAEAPDETVPDAGCPIGQEPGPLGTCVPEEVRDAGPGDGGCAHTCASDGDCAAGTFCGRDDRGCSICRAVCSPTTCRVSADCCNGAVCASVERPFQGCGACQRLEDECGPEAPCGEGSVCAEQEVQCSCTGEPVKRCVPDCREGACPRDQTCGADGVCRPTTCTAGFTCPALQRCTFPDGDAHGCAPDPCRRDADCPGGFCVNGGCSRAIGSCELPRP